MSSMLVPMNEDSLKAATKLYSGRLGNRSNSNVSLSSLSSTSNTNLPIASNPTINVAPANSSTTTSQVSLESTQFKQQICVLIDTTNLMKPHYSDFLIRCIKPCLEQLKSKSNNNEYAIVMFQNHPPYGDFLVKSVPFIRNYIQFIQMLENLNDRFYSGGQSECCIADALACALTDIYWDPDCLKYCFLVSSKPVDHPCILPGPYEGYSYLALLKEMASSGILISIISTYNQHKKLSLLFEASQIPFVDSNSQSGTNNTMDTSNDFDSNVNIKPHIKSLLKEASKLRMSTSDIYSPGKQAYYIEIRGVKLKTNTVPTNTTNNPTNAPVTTTSNNTGVVTNGQITVGGENGTTTTNPSVNTNASGNVAVNNTNGLLGPLLTTNANVVSPMANNTSTSSPPTIDTTKSPGATTTPVTSESSGSTSPPTVKKPIGTQPAPKKRVIVWSGNLKLQTGDVICKLQASAMRTDVTNDQIFVSRWPKEIEIQKNSPMFKPQIILGALKKYQNTLCLWEPISDVDNKYYSVISTMTSKKLCTFQQLEKAQDDDQQKFLVLFPFDLYKSMSKNTTQKETKAVPNKGFDKRLISVIVDKSCTNQTTAPPNTNNPTPPPSTNANATTNNNVTTTATRTAPTIPSTTPTATNPNPFNPAAFPGMYNMTAFPQMPFPPTALNQWMMMMNNMQGNNPNAQNPPPQNNNVTKK
ncbi:hypothetical protein ABK040_015689 [Willaertia magna]